MHINTSTIHANGQTAAWCVTLSTDTAATCPTPRRYPDSWKRRGQARSALDDQAGALADLQKCYDLLPQFEGHAASAASRSEVCVERGLIFQKQRDYRSAVVEFARAVDHDGSNVQVGCGWCKPPNLYLGVQELVGVCLVPD